MLRCLLVGPTLSSHWPSNLANGLKRENSFWARAFCDVWLEFEKLR